MNTLTLFNALACFFSALASFAIAHDARCKREEGDTLIFLAACIVFLAAGILDTIALIAS